VQVLDDLALAVGALGEGVEVEALQRVAEALRERIPELHLAADPGGEDLELEDAAERGVGAQVAVRLQAAEALGQFRQHRFDLVALDAEPVGEADQRFTVLLDFATDPRQRLPELGVTGVARPQAAGQLDSERGPRQMVVEVDGQASS
jgi:hypothetical protein